MPKPHALSDSASGSSSEVQPRLAHPALGRRMRIQPQLSKDLFDHRSLQHGGDDLAHALKLLAVHEGKRPRVAVRLIDFIASLQAARLCIQ